MLYFLEETQMVLTAATYLDDEAVLRHLPWLTPEEVDEILERKDAEDMERLDKAERDRFATEQEEPITEPEE